jgi:hypothetical protein
MIRICLCSHGRLCRNFLDFFEGGIMTRKLGWLMLIAVGFTIAACAVHEPRPAPDRGHSDFDQKIFNQEKRIDQGIASGELTRREADVLQDNLNWIKRRYSQMRADGTLTPREMEKLDRMLERNSEMIYNKKRNRVERVY